MLQGVHDLLDERNQRTTANSNAPLLTRDTTDRLSLSGLQLAVQPFDHHRTSHLDVHQRLFPALLLWLQAARDRPLRFPLRRSVPALLYAVVFIRLLRTTN